MAAYCWLTWPDCQKLEPDEARSPTKHDIAKIFDEVD
jgi:hypothetical protein